MKPSLRKPLSGLFCLLFPAMVLAAPAPEHDHNHGQVPAAADASATPTGMPAAPASSLAGPDDGRTDQQLQRMRDLHEKMLAAKTPAERQKLRAESMKLMQDSMTMMKDTQSGGMGMMSKGGMTQGDQAGMMGMCMDMHKAMAKRMDMMEMMMQTLLDQQSAAPMKQ